MSLPPRLPTPPVVGALWPMLTNPLPNLLKAAEIGEVVHLHFPSEDGVLLCHPDHIRHVLVRNFQRYGKGTRGYDAIRVGLGLGLVTSDGELWRRQRRLMQPTFSPKVIVGFHDTMVDVTERMIDGWMPKVDRGASIDVASEFTRLTLSVIGRSLLSVDLADESKSISRAVSTLVTGTLDRITNPVSMPLEVPVPANLRLRRAVRELDRLVAEMVRERKAANRQAPQDLFDRLMDATDEDSGEGMSTRQLRDELVTLILSGHETTANALAWTMHLLAEHPDVADRAMREVFDVLQGASAPSHEQLDELPYLQAVLMESLRFYPPIWMVARLVEEDDEIGGYHIPQGWVTFISPHVPHRDKRFWTRPSEFRPERFLDDEEVARSKPAYLPFIVGPRKCLGETFALYEAKIVLAMILAKLKPRSAGRVRVDPSLTLRPKGALQLTLNRVGRRPVGQNGRSASVQTSP